LQLASGGNRKTSFIHQNQLLYDRGSVPLVTAQAEPVLAVTPAVNSRHFVCISRNSLVQDK